MAEPQQGEWQDYKAPASSLVSGGWQDYERPQAPPTAPQKGVAMDLGNPRTVPNARIRNLPDPSDPNAGAWNLYEGAKSGLELGSIPATIGEPIAPVLRTVAGGIVGGIAGRGTAKAIGAGDRAQEVAGDVGSVAGGGLANSRIGRFAARVGQDALTDIPILRKLSPRIIIDAWEGTAPPKAPTPSAPPVAAETIPPELTTEARTLPGQIGKEVIYPRIAPAEPIAARSGLMLPPGPEPLAGSMVRSVEETSPAAASPAAKTPPSLTKQIATAIGKPNPIPAPSAERLDSLRNLGTEIERGLGNEPLQVKPGVRIGDQGVEIPEGHTPTESTAVRSFRYNPEARELEVFPHSGRTVYVYGDVSPEQAEAFGSADSKGAAWKQLRESSSPQVATIVNGKRISTVPGQLKVAPGLSIPKKSAGMAPELVPTENPDDLSASWQQNVDYLKNLKRR